MIPVRPQGLVQPLGGIGADQFLQPEHFRVLAVDHVNDGLEPDPVGSLRQVEDVVGHDFEL